jgi:HAD superfamily hydrolase (TIGR01549 family)
MMSIETVSFDAGGVLVFPNWNRISDALGRHGLAVSCDALASADLHVKRELDTSETIARTDDERRGWLYFDLLFARLGIEPGEQTQAAVEELYAYHRQFNLWESVPEGVVPAVQSLRRLGLRLIVVSNANGRIQDLFTRIGLAPFFGCLVDSHLEGVEKPDPRLFRLALARAGARPETTLHIGDMYHVDVRGAQAAGLSAVLLDPADLYAGADCPRVRSLAGLVKMLEKQGSPWTTDASPTA